MPSVDLAMLQTNPPTVVARADDSAARLRALATDQFQFVYRVLRRLLPPDAVDDATQRTFMITAAKIDQVAIGAERAWLFQTAVRVALHARRSQARRCEVEEDAALDIADTGARPDDAADRAARVKMLDWVLDHMAEDLRTVFVLFELEEMPSTDIAPLLDLPVGTVASRLRRAREEFHAQAKRLRSRLEFEGGRS